MGKMRHRQALCQEEADGTLLRWREQAKGLGAHRGGSGWGLLGIGEGAALSSGRNCSCARVGTTLGVQGGGMVALEHGGTSCPAAHGTMMPCLALPWALASSPGEPFTQPVTRRGVQNSLPYHLAAYPCCPVAGDSQRTGFRPDSSHRPQCLVQVV